MTAATGSSEMRDEDDKAVDGPERVNPLLAEVSGEDSPAGRLMEILWDSYAQRGKWPIFQYAEACLYRDTHQSEATATLRECPWVPWSHGLGHYGWFWVTENRLDLPQPGDTIGLTMLGMSRVQGFRKRPQLQAEIIMFLAALRAAVESERNFNPDPTQVQQVRVEAEEFAQRLAGMKGIDAPERPVSRLREIFRHEPVTMSCVFGTDESWHLVPSPAIRKYAGVEGLGDYADRVLDHLAPEQPRAMPIPLSSLALPEAIDYLNVVWRERAGSVLFRVRRAEAAAKVALDCNSRDEFDARLSALCNLVSHLQLPGHPQEQELAGLKPYLGRILPEDGRARAQKAVTTLQALYAVRASRQHSGGDADRKAGRGMRELGLQLPTADWAAVWQQVRAVTVDALNTIREEVERIDRLDLPPD